MLVAATDTAQMSKCGEGRSGATCSKAAEHTSQELTSVDRELALSREGVVDRLRKQACVWECEGCRRAGVCKMEPRKERTRARNTHKKKKETHVVWHLRFRTEQPQSCRETRCRAARQNAQVQHGVRARSDHHQSNSNPSAEGQEGRGTHTAGHTRRVREREKFARELGAGGYRPKCPTATSRWIS